MPLPADRVEWTPDPLSAECPSRAVLDLITDKWTVLVMATIEEGRHRISFSAVSAEFLRRCSLARCETSNVTVLSTGATSVTSPRGLTTR